MVCEPLPASAKWTTQRLFANGEVGLILDPSDHSTLFQDSAGITPVTAPGQPVGLVLDKSRGLVRGPERITNGTFDVDIAGWAPVIANINWNNGALQIEHNSNVNAGRARTTAAIIEPEKTYEVTWEVVQFLGDATTTRFQSGDTNANQVPAFSAFSSSSIAGIGTKRVIARSGAGATSHFGIFTNGTLAGGGGVVVDNVSVRELPGNHPLQATAAARPIYGLLPKGLPRRNLLLNTGDMTLGFWNLFDSSKASREVFGTVNGEAAIKLTATVDTNAVMHITSSAVQVIAEQRYRVRANFKDVSNGFGMLMFGTSGSWNVRARIDLSTGAIAQATSNVQDIWRTSGWYTIPNPDGSFEVGATVWAVQNANAQVSMSLSKGITLNSTNAIGDAFLISAPQLEYGEVSTPYQRIGSSYNSVRNLLVRSEDFASTAWGKSSGVLVGNEYTAPVGVTATYLLEQVVPIATSATTLTASIVVKPGISGTLTTSFEIDAYQTNNGTTRYARFNLETNTVVIQSECVGGILPLEDGKKLVWITYPGSVVLPNSRIRFIKRFSVVGDGSSVFLYRTQLEIGPNVTGYQKTLSQYEVLEDGVESCHYLQFDGIDDSLVTPSVNLSGGDKMTLVAGVRKLTDAAFQTVLEHTANPESTDGGFGIGAASNSGDSSRRTFFFTSRGTTGNKSVVVGQFPAPTSAVLSARLDNAATDSDQVLPQTNAKVGGVVSSSVDTSPGNFADDQMFIGRRGGTSSSLNGQIFGLVVRNTDSTAAEVAQSEKLLASNTNATTLL